MKTDHMALFRHLLSQSTSFEWNDELETALKKSKEKIVELIKEGVAAFNMDLVTCLSPDYSKEGMGWILQQKICECPDIIPTCCEEGWRLVLAGGHSAIKLRRINLQLRVKPPLWPGDCKTTSTTQWVVTTCTWPPTTPPL